MMSEIAMYLDFAYYWATDSSGEVASWSVAVVPCFAIFSSASVVTVYYQVTVLI